MTPDLSEARESAQFHVGQCVQKRSGYRYPGVVIGICATRAGAVRYVVEADHPSFRGMLHIFSGEQLIAAADIDEGRSP